MERRETGQLGRGSELLPLVLDPHPLFQALIICLNKGWQPKLPTLACLNMSKSHAPQVPNQLSSSRQINWLLNPGRNRERIPCRRDQNQWEETVTPWWGFFWYIKEDKPRNIHLCFSFRRDVSSWFYSSLLVLRVWGKIWYCRSTCSAFPPKLVTWGCKKEPLWGKSNRHSRFFEVASQGYKESAWCYNRRFKMKRLALEWDYHNVMKSTHLTYLQT